MAIPVEQIAQIVDQLDQPDVDHQRELMNMLLSLGPEILDPLAANLQFARPRARECIAQVLGELGDSKALLPLMRFVFDHKNNIKNSDARGLAMQAIMKLTTPEHSGRVFKFLMDVRQDEDPFVRGWAIEAMGKFGDKRAAPLIQDAIKDKNEFVRERAHAASIFLNTQNATENGLKSTLTESELLQAIRSAKTSGERTFHLHALLEHDNAADLAIRMVHEGGSGTMIGLQLLQDLPDKRARAIATEHFCASDSAAEHAVCLRLLAKHLCGDANTDELQIIQAGLLSTDNFVRLAAIAAAGASGHEPFMRKAIEIIQKHDAIAAVTAAESLTRGLNADFKRLVPDVLKSLRFARKRRIGMKTNEDAVHTEAYLLGALSLLTDGLILGLSDVQHEALESLKDAEQSWPVLISALRLLRDTTPQDGLAMDRRWSSSVCMHLLPLLEHPKDKVQKRALDLLLRGAPPGFSAIVQKLEHLIYDDHIDMTGTIIPLLELATGERATRLLKDLSGSPDTKVADIANAALRRMRNDTGVINASFSRSPDS